MAKSRSKSRSQAPNYQALLLVDGYNVIGYWPDLRQARDQLGLEEARHQLAQALISYSASQEYDTQIVFDAQYRRTPSNQTQERLTPHLSLVYTDFSQTADTYIERLCADFRRDLRRFTQRLIVCTNDRAQELTVRGYGAEWISAERLATEVEMAARQTQRRQKPVTKPNARFLANSLDPEAQARLRQLRLDPDQRGSD
jgi:uncharacterized protein